MAHLFVWTIGGVQALIAGSRRSRDLWFSSWLLSDISRVAAKTIRDTIKDAGGKLIFPSPEATNILNLTTLYVKSDFAANRPIPGTQTLEVPLYIIFGDLDFAEAGRLAQRNDYARAARMQTELSGRTSIPALQRAKYATLA